MCDVTALVCVTRVGERRQDHGCRSKIVCSTSSIVFYLIDVADIHQFYIYKDHLYILWNRLGVFGHLFPRIRGNRTL